MVASLSDEDYDHIADRLALRLRGNGCSCGLSAAEQKEMGHLFGMLRDEGAGNPAHSIEITREMIRSRKATKALAEMISKHLIKIVTVALGGWIVYLVIEVVKKTVAAVSKQ